MLTEQAFINDLAARLSWESDSIQADTRIDSLPKDRAAVAYLYRALSELLGNPPSELVRSIETIGEAYEWYTQRQESAAANPEEDAPRVFLRPIEQSDHWPLYMAAIRPATAFRWRYRGATPSFERFVAGLHDGVLVQHMVQAVDGPTIGLVVCYQASMESRTAYFGFMRTAETSQEGRMFEGLMLFLKFVFETWDMRKLYAEVPEYNFTGILSVDTRGIDVEGVQKGHLFHDGRWWDQYLIAVWRERWNHELAAWFGEDSPGHDSLKVGTAPN